MGTLMYETRMIISSEKMPSSYSRDYWLTYFLSDIYLVRHGQYHTKEKDPKLRTLTDLGKKQARLTGKWLKATIGDPDQFVFSVSTINYSLQSNIQIWITTNFIFKKNKGLPAIIWIASEIPA